ncbi:hypothetical protein KCTC52924_02876 [Arenibacter antarcticus]|uniref:Magnesium citrate secondary transporter n=1 Tax=Arenibacter antarcticus TaxID=2040469 RepID=A0ABW5VI54_9FLAO|nr:hypothetical protein [Arenibacter sp. H213]MCM4167293.1 hypothetical protein [Arenibacter sp. H213]
MRFQFNKLGEGLFWIKRMYFPLFSILGVGIYTIQRWGSGGILPSWVIYYVNDFLCMPIVLYICQLAVRRLKSNKRLKLTLRPILSLTLFYSLYFEVYLPMVNVRYTADLMDVVLYFLGAAFFYLVEKMTVETKESKVIYR